MVFATVWKFRCENHTPRSVVAVGLGPDSPRGQSGAGDILEQSFQDFPYFRKITH